MILILPGVIILKNEENKLTERQKDTLLFINDFIKNKGYSPSIKEVAQGIYVSKFVAFKHIEQLKNKGYINYIPHTPRTITILKIS